MTGLVISNRFLFTRFDDFAAVFKSAHDTVDRIQEILFFHGRFIFPGSDQRGSKVQLVCPKCGKGTRVGYKFVDGKKIRVCKQKKCGAEI